MLLANYFLLLFSPYLCIWSSHLQPSSLTFPRGFPRPLTFIITFCYELNITFMYSQVIPLILTRLLSVTEGKKNDKQSNISAFIFLSSFSYLCLLLLTSPSFPTFALSWELETYIFSFSMLKSKVLFQHILPVDQHGYQRALFARRL